MSTLPLALILAALPAFATTVQPSDVYRIRHLAELSFAPDGRSAVYTLRQADEKSNSNKSDIWQVTLPRGAARQLTVNGGATSPLWSPTGQQLAYLATAPDGKKQVYSLRATGGEPALITRLAGGVSAFAWSPDGKRLVCVSLTGRPRNPEETLYFQSPAYKFDGVGFYDDRRTQLWIVDADTGQATPLTNDSQANDTAPQWSPDGKQIAFVRVRTDGRGPRQQALFVISSTGGEPLAVGGPTVGVRSPAWSSDGRRIAFIGCKDAIAIPLLWLWEPGSAPRVVNNDFSYVDAITWDASGQSLLFSGNYRGLHPVFRMDIARGTWSPVANAPTAKDWAWHAATETLVRVASSASRAEELYLGASQLTNHNQQYAQSTQTAPMERFTYKGAGGWDIDAFLLSPPNRPPGRKYPLIVSVHGGPNGMFEDEWSLRMQVLAASGWAVLLTNPRGSSGYGEAFQRGVDREWGGKAYEDIQLGVDAALARYPWLNAERLGITGWSYGGFMTDWTVGQTNRFRAAVSVSGISNFLSVEGTRDGYYGHTRDFGGDLWQAHDLYWRYSPVRNAGSVKTPTLLLHGSADQRVPLEQSEQFFRALQHFHVPSEFVIFPGEPHSIGRKPLHEADVCRWLVYWFQRYLDSDEKAVRPNAQ
jgi:acylaminoacyl-peptidase